MRAVLYRLRRWLPRRWLTTTVTALAVAGVTGAVLLLAAGASRTGRAPDAFTAAVGGDVDAQVRQESGPSRVAEVAALPAVRSAEAFTFLFGVVAPGDGSATSDQGGGGLAFAGSRTATSRVIDGRLPDEAHPHEFVASQSFAAASHARVGDQLLFKSWTPAQVEQGQIFSGEPGGPTFPATLVGITSSAESLENASNAVNVFPTSLLTSEGADIAVGQTLMSVRLQPGATKADLRSQLDGLPDGAGLIVEPGEVVGKDVRNAVDAQARGLWLMAGVAAVAALVALGQLLSRHARMTSVEQEPLVALGTTTSDITMETVGRAGVPAAVGVLVGAVLAYAGSGLFPSGFVRAIEPSLGLHFDPTILLLGALVLFVALMVWVSVALVVYRHRAASSSTRLHTDAIARRAPSPAAATGIRFAFTGSERASTSVVGTLLGLVLLVAGAVGATTFATSVDHLVSHPSQFGNDYQFAVGGELGLSADELRSKLAGAPDVEGLSILTGATVRAGEASVGLIGVEHLLGNISPPVLSGRLPAGPDEVALGRLTADDLGVHIGDRLELAGSDGTATMNVVGLAVVPGLGGIDGVGQGGVVTADGLARLTSQPDGSLAAVDLRRGAPAGAADRVGALVGSPPGRESSPSAIVNVSRIRSIPVALAILLGVLAALALIHALLVSISGRRRDLAVLRAVGADGPWIGRAVHWQATALVAGPIVARCPPRARVRLAGVPGGRRWCRRGARRDDIGPAPRWPSWPASSCWPTSSPSSRRARLGSCRPPSCCGASDRRSAGPPALRVEEPGLVGEHHGLHTVAEAELLEDVGDVRLHRGLADVELGADLRVGQPAGDQAEHLHLALGQLVEVSWPGGPGHAGELLDDALGDRRRQERVAVGHRADGGEELLGRVVLEDEAAGPDAQRLVDVLVEIERRQDQDAGRPVGGQDPPSGLQPVELGHPDVHEHDARLQAGGLLDGLAAVGGLTDDVDVGLAGQEHAEADADHGLVVGHQDPDRHDWSRPTGRLARRMKPRPPGA